MHLPFLLIFASVGVAVPVFDLPPQHGIQLEPPVDSPWPNPKESDSSIRKAIDKASREDWPCLGLLGGMLQTMLDRMTITPNRLDALPETVHAFSTELAIIAKSLGNWDAFCEKILFGRHCNEEDLVEKKVMTLDADQAFLSFLASNLTRLVGQDLQVASKLRELMIAASQNNLTTAVANIDIYLNITRASDKGFPLDASLARWMQAIFRFTIPTANIYSFYPPIVNTYIAVLGGPWELYAKHFTAGPYTVCNETFFGAHCDEFNLPKPIQLPSPPVLPPPAEPDLLEAN
jgi:hypothetical protein